MAELKARKVLIDGKAGALLLQIFSENQLGPIFFEFIQRKGDQGFGEGNFGALFESIELDQVGAAWRAGKDMKAAPRRQSGVAPVTYGTGDRHRAATMQVHAAISPAISPGSAVRRRPTR